jgi:hypothetical protein
MTALNFGFAAELFVTNVLNGTVNAGGGQVNEGTVLRLLVTTPDRGMPRLLAVTTIGSGFPEKTDPNALVIGPTGVGLGADGTLYVADTLDNRIAAIRDAVFRFESAGTGQTVSQNGALNGPLGLAVARDGDILTVNSGDGNLVETTPWGDQADVTNLDSTGSPPPPGGAGALFGLAVAPHGKGVYYVNDNSNTLNLLHKLSGKGGPAELRSAGPPVFQGPATRRRVLYGNLRLALEQAIESDSWTQCETPTPRAPASVRPNSPDATGR